MKNRCKNVLHVKPEDVLEVVHIIDTDGTFISDSSIRLKDVKKTMYYDSGIETNNIVKIRLRNKQKSEVIRRMLTMKNVVKTIPYNVYYFSSNMDHVLHNNANLSRAEKNDLADDFDDRYADDPEGFIKLMCDSDFSIKSTYKDSWAFIQQDNNSVCRFSNFSIYLQNTKR